MQLRLVGGREKEDFQGKKRRGISSQFYSYSNIDKVFYSENQCLYSTRLYRNIQHKGDVSAIFCVCLSSPIYTKVI